MSLDAAMIPQHQLTLDLKLEEDGRLYVTISDVLAHVKAGRSWNSKDVQLASQGLQDGDIVEAAQAHVTESLFPKAVREYVEARVQKLGVDGDWRFRLRLALHSAPLGGVPWELAQLHLLGESPLVSDPRFSIVRAPTGTTEQPVVTIPERCRVLYASARRVGGFAPLDSSSLKAIEVAAEATGQLKIATLADVTAEELRLALAQPFDVFHFSGHGLAEPDRAGIVVNTKRHAPADDAVLGEDDLVEMLQGKATVVVLACCHSAAAHEGAKWSSLAGSLVEAGIPAVVAMQQKIGNTAAASFSRGFYEGLVRTRSIDEAVASGRRRLQRGYSLAVPVLYSRAAPGPIASKRAAIPTADEARRAARPSAVTPACTLDDPGHRTLATVALDGRSWGLVADGATVAFRGYGAHTPVRPWRVGVPVQDVAVTQDGVAIVALAGGRLHVTAFDAYNLEDWSTTFVVPADHDRVLAVRRGDYLDLEVLVAGAESNAIVACADGRAVPPPQHVPGEARDAVGGESGFVRIDPDGRFAGPSDHQTALLSAITTTGWLAVDRAKSGGQEVTVAAHDDGVVYVVGGNPARIRWVSVPDVSRVHAVRPLNGQTPGAIAAAAGGVLQQWTIDALDAAVSGSPT